ncbi:transforming growth factor-beta-induced protein ig-h3-like [Mya arenaria]|uniref:transforming growth factor-beta-induced protein ig-h3-like n=1 Tax=Mya arenaria TaxID=6604 RepID=UPI0022E2DC29|nr:transforming growth factor-beta-induced protein ig-h3-like [Mya arenaria]
MKCLCLFAFLGVCGVLGNDQIWVQLMSSQIEEAAGYDVLAADKNIPTLAGDLGLKTLVTLVKKANLVDTLSGPGPFTVFGPTDQAFAALPKKFVDFLMKNMTVLTAILEYHVASGKVLSSDLKNNMLVPSVQGKDIRINIYKDGKVITASGRPVTLPDQEATNGVIHVVSGVLFPPAGTVVDVVSKCPVFKTLLKAVTIAGLADTLSGAGPFTVFAPSDKAFARIPKKCIDALLKNKTLLTSVLEYHVAPAVDYSAGLSCGDDVKTLNGASVKITKMFGHLRVNYARVVYADASVTNGVMHVIDRVLFPREMNDLCGDDVMDYDDDSSETEVFVPFQ